MEIKVGSYWRDRDTRHFIVQIKNVTPKLVDYNMVRGISLTESLCCRKDRFHTYYVPLNRLEVLVLFGETIDEV